MKKQFYNIPEQPDDPVPLNPWFCRRQDFFVKNVFREFFKSYRGFTVIYEQYPDCGQITFADIEQLVGAESNKGLWLLKNQCHQLWRHGGLQPGRENSFFLDWLIGSLFHEAMKLKENIYIISRYVPIAHEIDDLPGREEVTGNPAEWQRFLSSARREIPKQVENLAFLFGRAAYFLRRELINQGENMLLLRYFFENPDMLKELWSESLEEIFTDLFPAGPEYGYCLVGKSYLDGHWHEQALAAYSAALKLNKKCDDALRRISQLRVILRNNAEMMLSVS